jgi:hypothetical protein
VPSRSRSDPAEEFPPPILFLNRPIDLPQVPGRWVLSYVEILPDRTLWRFRGSAAGSAGELGRTRLRLVGGDGVGYAWLGAISGGSHVGEEVVVAFDGVPAPGPVRLVVAGSDLVLTDVDLRVPARS